jgi:SAM-dependent methyltransferase
MGWGYWVKMAEAFGLEAHGAEVSESRLDHAERLGLNVLRPEELAGHRFDFINTEQVFEHLPDPAGTALELAGLLRDGGILKVSVPTAIRVKRLLARGKWTGPGRNPMKDVFPFQHINAFIHRSVIALGRRAGLEPVPIPARIRYRYMPTWERPGRLARRVAGQHYRALRRQETMVWFRRAGSAVPR